MIHDLFLTRYPQRLFYTDEVSPQAHSFFMQVAHIVFGDLVPALKIDREFFRQIHDAVAREMGVGKLFDESQFDAICGRFLTEQYDLWNGRHGTADQFLKARLSLVELTFRALEERVNPAANDDGEKWSDLIPPWRRAKEKASPLGGKDSRESVVHAVQELNQRFRQAGMPFHFHNGIVQFARDELTEATVAEPCWELLKDSRWTNVDRELKEAFDHADRGHVDAVFHAGKALESTLKVISDERELTSGSERGASNYIDNLGSKANGALIAPWEAEMLRLFFRHIRNPHGHGAGSQPPPTMSDVQVSWALEAAMGWIKSLIRRH